MAISVLLAPLQNLLNTFQSERHYKDDKKDAALSAINEALLETKRYIEESDGKDGFDRKREFALAKLWGDAAVKARYANAEMASRLHDKSLYWSEQLKWSREEVLAKKIDFESLHNTLNELMTSGCL